MKLYKFCEIFIGQNGVFEISPMLEGSGMKSDSYAATFIFPFAR